MSALINSFLLSGVAGLGALAYASADQTRGTVTNEPVLLDTEVYDLGGWHSVASDTGRMTVPNGASLVRVIGNCANDGSSYHVFAHRKGGATFAGRGGGGSITAGNESLNLASAIVAASPTDYFEFCKVDSGSVTVIGDGRTWFSIEKIDAATQYALVNKTGSQSISASTTTVLTWDAEVADVGGWHDNVTNNSRLTVPSGVTLVRVSAGATNSTLTNTQNLLAITKNGSSARGLPAKDVEVQATDHYLNVVSAIMEVTAGDYFEATYFSGLAETVPANTLVWMCIEEVSASLKRALVYKSGTQAISAATTTALAFGAEVYDTDSIHDNSTNNSRLTVPSGCTYARLSFGLKNPSTAGQLVAAVTKNGVANIPGLPNYECDTAGTDNLSGFGAWVPVTPGDYFEMTVFSTNAVTLGTDNELWFSMECF